MRDMIMMLLSIPVSIRAAILVTVLFVVWRTFKRQILSICSILPWVLKQFFIGIYFIIDFPLDILHKKFGSVFGSFDQWWALSCEKVCFFMDSWFKKMKRSTNNLIHRRTTRIYFGILIYLLVPLVINLTEAPFTFWQEPYIKKETALIYWMDDKGWLEKK